MTSKNKEKIEKIDELLEQGRTISEIKNLLDFKSIYFYVTKKQKEKSELNKFYLANTDQWKIKNRKHNI